MKALLTRSFLVSFFLISSFIGNAKILNSLIEMSCYVCSYANPNSITWTGNVNSDWFTADNWNPPTVPGTTMEAEIGILSNSNYPVISGNNAEIANLTIYAGANLRISPTGNLKVNYQTICNGEIFVESNNSGQSGSIIDNGFSGTGTFTYIRNIKSMDTTITDCEDSIHNNNPQGWHYLSSPVSGLTTFSIPIGDYWVNDWSETDNSWYNFAPGSNIPCIPGANNQWLPMKGYSVKYCPAYNCPQFGTGETVEFSGSINNVNTGEISIECTASNNLINDFSNWNLIGNPYPSAIDPSTVFFPIYLDASIYFWDDVNLTYQAWAGGVGPNIPPAQGFFIHAPRYGPLTFTNANRSFNGNNVFFKSTIDHLLTLEASGNSYTDRTSIRFLDEALPAFDRLWDAYKLITKSPGVPQLYTSTALENLAINTQPSIDIVPLFFEAGSSGNYTLKIAENNDFDEVILEDLVTGQKTDLIKASFSFSYVAGSNPGRFKVHFSSLSVPDYVEKNTRITSNANGIRITFPTGSNANVQIYDLLGRLVASRKVLSGENDFQLTANNSIHIVRVTSGQQVFTKKIFVNW